MEGILDRCVLCAWCEPRDSLRDIRTFGAATELPFSIDNILYVHDFCWQRLMRHFDQVPHLEKLIEVLRITRIPKYRGAIAGYSRPKHFRSAVKSMNIEDIRTFIRMGKIRKNNRMPRRVNMKYEITAQADCFILLPVEVRLIIAQYLSTTDFLTLRLSSKAMSPLFDCEQFWRTIFLVNGERGYLSFLTERRYRDWRLLYRCSRPNFEWPTRINDWRKQWLSNETVRDRYIMTQETDTALPNDGDLRLERSNAILNWQRAPKTCKSHLYGNEFVDRLLPLPLPSLISRKCSDCYRKEGSMKCQTVIVSCPVLKVAIYAFVEDENTFISGFDLIHSTQSPYTGFGYRVPGKQTVIDLCGRELKGFEMKIQRTIGGVEALRPITQDVDAIFHDWVGDFENPRTFVQSQTIKLAPNRRVVAIAGNFQDCKLMDLAIGSHSYSIDAA